MEGNAPLVIEPPVARFPSVVAQTTSTHKVTNRGPTRLLTPSVSAGERPRWRVGRVAVAGWQQQLGGRHGRSPAPRS